MAIDVLNLIAIVRAEGGQPGPLATADPDNIGLWGHSMGGGISLRTLTVSRDVKAAVLYAAMSGDERRNFEAIQSWSGGRRGIAEVAVPDEALVNISPINFLDRIKQRSASTTARRTSWFPRCGPLSYARSCWRSKSRWCVPIRVSHTPSSGMATGSSSEHDGVLRHASEVWRRRCLATQTRVG